MLILTRKKNESIKINENIEVTILDMDGGSVKLGINAPKSVRILRSELTQKIQASNEQATRTNKSILKKMIEKLTEK